MRCEGWRWSVSKTREQVLLIGRCSGARPPGAASRNKTPWPDPSPTCTLRHTNDNGCKPINHQMANGWERRGCSGTSTASVQESILKFKEKKRKKSWLNAPLYVSWWTGRVTMRSAEVLFTLLHNDQITLMSAGLMV